VCLQKWRTFFGTTPLFRARTWVLDLEPNAGTSNVHFRTREVTRLSKANASEARGAFCRLVRGLRHTRARLDTATMALETAVSAMSAGEIVLVIFACCVGALMMGAVGMGGVVILPALLVAGIDVGPAIVSIYLAVMPASLMKLLVLGRTPGVIPWRAALSCGCTAAIGAAVGGVLVESSPRRVLTFLVGAMAALAGLRDVREIVSRKLRERREKMRAAAAAAEAESDTSGRVESEAVDDAKDRPDGAATIDVEVFAPAPRETSETDPREKSFRRRFADWYFLPEEEHIPHAERWYADRHEMATLAAVGLLVGCASVLTGTGGPLILIPILMTWKGAEMNRKVIVGCTSVMAGFLACAATASLLAAGVTPDAGLVLLIAPCAISGIAVGARLLQIASREFLQAAMTVLLLAVAALTISKAAAE
jgi:uncharacterized membrane protein YfcA